MDSYDRIKCEAKLPGNPPLVVELLAQYGIAQTRSLGCEMKSYTITADGNLLVTEYESESVPEKHSYFGGRYRQIIRETKLADYQGVITFQVMTPDARMYLYIARFINGEMQEIRQVGSE